MWTDKCIREDQHLFDGVIGTPKAHSTRLSNSKVTKLLADESEALRACVIVNAEVHKCEMCETLLCPSIELPFRA